MREIVTRITDSADIQCLQNRPWRVYDPSLGGQLVTITHLIHWTERHRYEVGRLKAGCQSIVLVMDWSRETAGAVTLIGDLPPLRLKVVCDDDPNALRVSGEMVLLVEEYRLLHLSKGAALTGWVLETPSSEYVTVRLPKGESVTVKGWDGFQTVSYGLDGFVAITTDPSSS